MNNLKKITLLIVLAAAPLCTVAENNSEKAKELTEKFKKHLEDNRKLKNDFAKMAKTQLDNAEEAYKDCILKKSEADCLLEHYTIAIENLHIQMANIKELEKLDKDLLESIRIFKNLRFR